MQYRRFFTAFLLFSTTLLSAQEIAVIEVKTDTIQSPFNRSISLNLDAITSLPDSVLSLVEMRNQTETELPTQITHHRSRTLYWFLDSESNKKHIFKLIQKKPQSAKINIQLNNEQDVLFIKSGDKTLFGYQFGTKYPPAGVDSAYKRSGFIHPLFTPRGQLLTHIQPEDHYHHYGIWNPWTKVAFAADTVDFWNLAKRQGTVRFAHFISQQTGPVFGEYAALHEHVVFNKDGSETVALNELQTVRVYTPGHADHYIMDLTISLNCATALPFKLVEYRYAGLGWRAAQNWNHKNSEVLTSAGHTRKTADGTTARWFFVQGELDGDFGGMVLMSHPANYNHPEPVRIWPEPPEGHGEVFVNYAPTKTTDWLLEPGRNYVLNYRFIVFNGRFAAEHAERGWQHFAHSPEIKITLPE